MSTALSVAPRRRGPSSLVAGVVVLVVLILVGNSPAPTVAKGPEAHPGMAVRTPRVAQGKERLEVELETSIGDLNRAIAEAEEALARLKSARRAARESLRAIRGEITRPAVSRRPLRPLRDGESLYERGILLFPDSIEKAMMGERVRRNPFLPGGIFGKLRLEPAPDAIRPIPGEAAPPRSPKE